MRRRILAWFNTSTALLTTAALLAAASTLVFLFRLEGTIARGLLFDQLNSQGFGILSIWKVSNGLPLYEWPDREYYNANFYNYLYYYFYGLSAYLSGINDERVVVFSRLFTAGCSV